MKDFYYTMLYDYDEISNIEECRAWIRSTGCDAYIYTDVNKHKNNQLQYVLKFRDLEFFTLWNLRWA